MTVAADTLMARANSAKTASLDDFIDLCVKTKENDALDPFLDAIGEPLGIQDRLDGLRLLCL